MDYFLTALGHWPNECWLLISEVLWHSPESNFAVAVSKLLFHIKSKHMKLSLYITQGLISKLGYTFPHALFYLPSTFQKVKLFLVQPGNLLSPNRELQSHLRGQRLKNQKDTSTHVRKLDSFTVPLHSPNGRPICQPVRAVQGDCRWPLKKYGSREPRAPSQYKDRLICVWRFPC